MKTLRGPNTTTRPKISRHRGRRKEGKTHRGVFHWSIQLRGAHRSTWTCSRSGNSPGPPKRQKKRKERTRAPKESRTASWTPSGVREATFADGCSGRTRIVTHRRVLLKKGPTESQKTKATAQDLKARLRGQRSGKDGSTFIVIISTMACCEQQKAHFRPGRLSSR
jgi:hypothetical protein